METFEENVRTKGKLMAELIRDRQPVVEACLKIQMNTRKTGNEKGFKTEIIQKSCARVDGDKCAACAFPDQKWRLGKCNLSTHLYHENKQGQPFIILTPVGVNPEEYIEEQQKLNPIKQSKRGF